MSIFQKLEALKEKVSLLKIMDKDFTTHGAKKHKYQFNPTLSEKEIEDFEQQYQVRLPEDYRAFLMRVGNGGAGPQDGLLPLKETVEFCNPQIPCKWGSWYHSSSSPGFRELEAIIDDKIPQDKLTAEEIQDAEQYNQRNGSIRLYGKRSSDQFFNLYFSEYLIVNGEAYGKVWRDDIPQSEIYVFGGYETFIEDYTDWLDRNLIYCIKEELVKKVQTGMLKSEVIQILGNDYREDSLPDALKKSWGFKPDASVTRIEFPQMNMFFLLQNEIVVKKKYER